MLPTRDAACTTQCMPQMASYRDLWSSKSDFTNTKGQGSPRQTLKKKVLINVSYCQKENIMLDLRKMAYRPTKVRTSSKKTTALDLG